MLEYTKEDGRKLLKLARESILEKFSGRKPEMLKEEKFKELRGVFVTLKKNEELRGCIGFPYPLLPVNEAVEKAALSAAFSDPRFLPLQKSEINQVKIEISILSVPKEVKNFKEIKIGRDGLICECEGRSGLLLPQVAVENDFSRKEFLECLCQKAGLDKEKWKEEKFKLSKFHCQIFFEKDL